MNQHTGRTNSTATEGRFIEVLPSGHSTIYQDDLVLADFILTEAATAEDLQKYMAAAQIPATGVAEVPLADGTTKIMTIANVSYITQEVLFIQNDRRSGYQRQGIRLRAELEAAYPELSWADMKRIMAFRVTGR